MNDSIQTTSKPAIENKSQNADENMFLTTLEKEKETKKLTYYVWLSRLCIFLSVSSLIVLMSFSLSLFKISPQVFVEPFMIISQDNTEDIVRAEAMIYDMASKDKILEIYMRQYIILRNTIIPDEVEMQTRWYPGGMIHFYSDDPIFAEFSTEVNKTISQSLRSKVSQSVVIDTIGKVGGDKSPIWKATFRTFELSPGAIDSKTGAMKLTTKYWTASISANFYTNRTFLGRRLMNPLGFTVIDYSQAQVNVF